VCRAPSLALATVLFVLFLTFLDNTIVTVVLAHVQSELHASVNQLQWVVNGYALTFASLMLTFGTLGDLFGRKSVMLAGVAVFCAGSVVSAVAPSPAILIAGRVVMGVGAAASEPGTLSMIRHLFPDRKERARSLGIWAAVSSMGLALGPLIGGVLVGVWSWRAIFWFNLFFGVLAFVSAAIVLPESKDPVNRRLDIPGFLIAAVALGAATFATILGETAGYATSWIALLYAGSVVAAVVFVAFERRAANPVLNVRYFKRPAFAGSNAIACLAYFGTFSLFFFVALYLQVVGSNSSLQTALDFVPMAIGMVVASVFTGRWVAAWGPRIPMAVGCFVAGAGILLTDAFITPDAGLGTVGWTMLIAGTGIGIALVPVTSAALGSTPPEHSGMAASMTNTSRELGAVAGVAVLGSIVNGQLTVNLVRRLSAIGIPKSYQQTVVSAVTTGAAKGEAKAAEAKNHSITHIVNEVIGAAYHAFGNGLHIALGIGGTLLLISAVVALLTVYGRRVHLDLTASGGHLLHVTVEPPAKTDGAVEA
jgi:EmrB/QacA subfamily drug resistance transporter